METDEQAPPQAARPRSKPLRESIPPPGSLPPDRGAGSPPGPAPAPNGPPSRLDDLEQGVRLGDPNVVLRAAGQFFEANRRLSIRSGRQLARFARSSSLQSRSRLLTARANELEQRIVALGSDLAEPKQLRRPKLPPGPEPRRSDSDERLSSLRSNDAADRGLS